jgi:hypothetical protein
MGVILLWARFFGPKPPLNPPQSNRPAQSAPAQTGSVPAIAPAATKPATSNVPAAPVNVPPRADTEERTIVVENSLYRVEFSNRGAVVKSWQLKQYKDDAKPPRVLDLVHPDASQQMGSWPFSLVLDDEQLESAANSGLYQVSTSGDVLQAPADAEFTWSDGHLEITKHFRFDHSYVVRVEMTAKLNGAPILAGLAWRGGFGDLTVVNPAPVETVSTYSSESGKLTDLSYKKLEGPEKWERLHGHRGPLLHGGVFAGEWGRSRKSTNAVLESVPYDPGGGKRNAGGRPGNSDGDSKYSATRGTACLCRTERLRRAEEDEPAAARAGEFRVARVHRGPVVPCAEVAAQIHSQLGLGDHPSYAGRQHAAFPAAHLELQNNAEDAARGARNQSDSGKI